MAAAKYRSRGSDALDLLLAKKNGERSKLAKTLRKLIDRSVLNRARIGERRPSLTTANKIRDVSGGRIPTIWWDQPPRGPRRCQTCGRSQ
jgi:hypothetical protein